MSASGQEFTFNPYTSYSVRASAGSGKTFQLSQRFLYLVAAGAEINSILTITFTKKAAAEMRQRIIGDAARLLSHSRDREVFSLNLENFYNNAKSQDTWLPLPKSPIKTAEEILSQTQALRISTIDSLFWEWLNKFPFESSLPGESCFSFEQLRLLDNVTRDELEDRAWRGVFDLEAGKDGFSQLLTLFPDDGLTAIRSRLKELLKHETYIWFSEERQITSSPVLNHFPDNSLIDPGMIPDNEAQLIKALTPFILKIVFFKKNAKAEQIQEALGKGDLSSLREAGFLKKDNTIMERLLPKDCPPELTEVASFIEKNISTHQNRRLIEALNVRGRAIFEIMKKYHKIRENEKKKKGFVEFSDLVKGAYRIFNEDQGLGARFLIQRNIRHLLFDEFQDTSWLQWAVFQILASELLAGEGLHAGDQGPRDSVFFVGDEKQSIYMFREADPKVMEAAESGLTKYGLKTLQLTESYRSSQIVLDYVDEVFSLPKGFPRHLAAKLNGSPIMPETGRVAVAPIFPIILGEKLSPLAREAEFVAEYLASALNAQNDALPHPVFDKILGRFRHLQANDCAILYRNATNAETFAKALRKKHLPCLYEEKKGFFARQEIQDMLHLLRVIAFPHDLLSWGIVLKSPIVGLSDYNVIELLQKTKFLEDSSLQIGKATRCLCLIRELQASRPEVAKILAGIFDFNGPLHCLLSHILTSLGSWNRYQQVFGEIEGPLAVQNILQFIEICLAREKEGFLSSPRLLERLILLSQKDETGNAQIDANAITLMTIHKAKGLEFPLVVLVETGDSWAKTDRYFIKGKNEENAFGIYYTGKKDERPQNDRNFEKINAALHEEIENENLRLLYVAMTRARQYLLVTGHTCRKDDNVGNGYHEQLMKAILSSDKPIKSLTLSVNSENMAFPAWERGIAVKENQLLSKVSLETLEKKISLPQNSALPSQMKIRRPHVTEALDHEEDSFGSDLDMPISLDMPRLHGIFIHKGLEAFWKGAPWQDKKEWESLISRPENASLLETEGQEKLAHASEVAASELRTILGSTAWKRLAALKQASIVPEMEIIYFNGKELLRGVIDLYLEDPEGKIVLVDYKTIRLPSRLTPEDLRKISHEHGYFSQLAAYCEAISALHPGAGKITGQIFFSCLQQFVCLV